VGASSPQDGTFKIFGPRELSAFNRKDRVEMIQRGPGSQNHRMVSHTRDREWVMWTTSSVNSACRRRQA